MLKLSAAVNEKASVHTTITFTKALSGEEVEQGIMTRELIIHGRYFPISHCCPVQLQVTDILAQHGLPGES
jgi:hypothetical protein